MTAACLLLIGFFFGFLFERVWSFVLELWDIHQEGQR